MTVQPFLLLPKWRSWRVAECLLLFLGMLLSAFVFAAPENSGSASNQTVSIITHPSNGIDALSLRELRATYAMKKRTWDDQASITVFVLENDHELHKRFCKKSLNIFPNQLESIWYRQVYTGTGQAPVRLQSEAEMIDRVSATPGSIGYIYNNNEHMSFNDEKIKTLTIY